MKKTLVALLSVLLIFALVSCRKPTIKETEEHTDPVIEDGIGDGSDNGSGNTDDNGKESNNADNDNTDNNGGNSDNGGENNNNTDNNGNNDNTDGGNGDGEGLAMAYGKRADQCKGQRNERQQRGKGISADQPYGDIGEKGERREEQSLAHVTYR